MARGNLILTSVIGIVCGMLSVSAAHQILVEAESFEKIGGWVIDQQFMDQMGSPFVMAHGLGRPVDDAVTTVRLPAAGAYRIWVRTRDWVAPWKRTDTPETKRAYGTPGVFNVLVNGTPLEPVFGAAGEEWHWQDGGVVSVQVPTIELALRDLTGFHGRCDAVFLSSDLQYMPPNDAPAAWRRSLLGLPEEPDPVGEYDLVVVGGGTAGVPAAISAARLGLKVALIQNRPVLGGNSSSEVRVGYTGRGLFEPYPRVGLLTQELEWSRKQRRPGQRYEGVSLEDIITIEDQRRMDLVRAETNIVLFLNYHVNEVRLDADGRIDAVTAQHIVNSRRISVQGRWFADCTGDANLGFLANADYDMAIPHMGRTNMIQIRRADTELFFPRCPWALDLSDKPFPGRGGEMGDQEGSFDSIGGWYWESGFDHDPIARGEYIRDWNFRARYGAWDVIKNIEKSRPRDEISWIAYVSGKRESRRLIGDLLLHEEDMKAGKKFPDGVVPTNWRLDYHIPNPQFISGFEGDAFIAISPKEDSLYPMPFWIPYRCLYSRNIPNLFMAGRNISVTPRALGGTRVQWQTGMMGEIVGMAALLCKQHNTDPRGVYESYLPDLFRLMESGVGVGRGVSEAAISPPVKGISAAAPLNGVQRGVLVEETFSGPSSEWVFSGPSGSRIEVHNGRLEVTVSDVSSRSSAAYLTFQTVQLKDGERLRLSVEVCVSSAEARKGDLRMGLGYVDPPGSPGGDFNAGVSGYHITAPTGGQRFPAICRWQTSSGASSDFLFTSTATVGRMINARSVMTEPVVWIFEIIRRGDQLLFSGSLDGEEYISEAVASDEFVISDFRFNTLAVGYLYAQGKTAFYDNVRLEKL
jgi:hypothetical protein